MTTLKPGQMVAARDPRYASLGLGFVEKSDEESVKVEFRPSVFTTPPYEPKVVVLRRQELEPVSSPVERLIAAEFDEPWRFELKQRAAHLVVSNRDGQFLQLPNRPHAAPDHHCPCRLQQSQTAFSHCR